MMKATVKKMILTAAMAAFMVSASAMAEEDLIIEESFEAVEETAVEEAQAIEIEVLGLETIATAEVPEEVAQAAETAETADNAEAAETEANAAAEEIEETEAAEAQSFIFENDEVIISAQAAAELPENIEMQVRKLEEGSEEYEAAKAAAAANSEAGEDAQYSFYDVTFTVDGNEVELADGSVYVQVEFKTVQISSEQTQEIFHIDETGANNVTAETEEGSNMSSVSFAM